MNLKDFEVLIYEHTKKNGKQYIGSSKNISNRLKDYYTNSYLSNQSILGSAICNAILKYGHQSFSLSIQVLGETPKDTIDNNSSNIPDYVTLEQFYLDNYILRYNINRNASSRAYSRSENLINIGKDNPSFDLTKENSFT